MIKDLTIADFSEIADLFNGYAFKQYSSYPKINKDLVDNYFYCDLINTGKDYESYILGLKEKSHYIAFCILKKAQIESETYKKNIFTITHIISNDSYIPSVNNKIKLLRYIFSKWDTSLDMVSCRTNINDTSTVHALEKIGFLHMDCLGTFSYEMPIKAKISKNPNCCIRLFQDSDLEKLKVIAKKSFTIDRFHSDCKLPKSQSDNLYKTFIENAAIGIGADKIMVAEHKNKVIGFNTIELENRLLAQLGAYVGSFVLNAVSSEYRNQGIYSSLINDSLIYLNNNVDYVEIKTHINNFPVHKVLPKFGFKLTNVQSTFHKWKYQ